MRKNSEHVTISEGWLWGHHAVAAALANPARQCRSLYLTLNARNALLSAGLVMPDFATSAMPADLDRLLPEGAVHQGVAGRFTAPADVALKTLANQQHSALILDSVTDPRNVGAICRCAAAFGFGGLVLQDRKAPPPFGAAAKAAVGTLERMQIAHVVNIANAILELREEGWTVIGLAGQGTSELGSVDLSPKRVAFVMGAEDKGLRERVASSCDTLMRIPIIEAVESLNVSVAAGIVCHARSVARHLAISARTQPSD
jgi:23S rRNA (guanosine2251-2'-O)-methyltransferase